VQRQKAEGMGAFRSRADAPPGAGSGNGGEFNRQAEIRSTASRWPRARQRSKSGTACRRTRTRSRTRTTTSFPWKRRTRSVPGRGSRGSAVGETRDSTVRVSSTCPLGSASKSVAPDFMACAVSLKKVSVDGNSCTTAKASVKSTLAARSSSFMDPDALARSCCSRAPP
jgi:hypothetical protein